MAELKEILEALIFVHRGAVSARFFQNLLKEEFSLEEIREALSALREDYEKRGGAIELIEVAGGY